MAETLLPRTGILAFMDDESREQFAGYGGVMETTANQVILKEDEANTNLFIVLSGAYKICTMASGREVHLDMVGPGDCLGEVAVFQPGTTSATVICTEPGQLWYIGVQNLQQFLTDWPFSGCAAVLGINTLLSRRLKRANAIIRSHQILPTFLSVRNKKRPANIA
jgi:CRP-like cAMP-binding protein